MNDIEKLIKAKKLYRIIEDYLGNDIYYYSSLASEEHKTDIDELYSFGTALLMILLRRGKIALRKEDLCSM